MAFRELPPRRHGREGFVPSGSRVIGGADHYLRSTDFDFDLVAETGLLQERLGDAHAARIADLDQVRFHNYIVITNTRCEQEGGNLQQTEVYFDGGHDGDGLAVFHAGFEAPFFYGFDGFLVQA